MFRRIRNLLFAIAFSASPVWASAPLEYTTESGDYVVHFSAMMTADLTADVARAYQIRRSKSVAMITVNVQRKHTDGPPTAVAAEIVTHASNLTGQPRNLSLRRIKEGESIYYVGTLPVSNEEIITFELSIRPDGETEPLKVRFKRIFYTS